MYWTDGEPAGRDLSPDDDPGESFPIGFEVQELAQVGEIAHPACGDHRLIDERERSPQRFEVRGLDERVAPDFSDHETRGAG